MVDAKTYKPQLEEGIWKFPVSPELQRNAHRYGELRQKEGRLFSDEVVAQLPNLSARHKYAREFALRKASMQHLIKCLQNHKARNILEIGCGNGWLLAHLVRHTGAGATGVDIYEEELKQAARVHADLDIDWILGDVFMNILPPASFDAVVVASAAQYFKDIDALVQRAKDLLKTGGHLFLTDTPWYRRRTQKRAAERTFDYYESMGMPWMSGQYHHHALEQLNAHRFKIIYNPFSPINRIKKRLGFPVLPFHHIAIKKVT